MNKVQKNIALIILGLFLLSTFFIPEKLTTPQGTILSRGYTFLWDLTYEVDIKVLVIEWIAIFVTGIGLIFILKK
jgi:hypothetical protein